MTDDGVIMCHPGIVDETLASLDSLTTLREREYDIFPERCVHRRAARP